MKDRKYTIGFRELRTFYEIVETGSATAAARSMGLTQPAVSRLLAHLEAHIGFELFRRYRGRLVLTPDGQLLFEEVDLSLSSLERVHSRIRDISEHRVGQLKLVAPPSFSEGVIPEIVAAFLERFPKVRLTIDSRSVETSKAMIATRLVDGGFLKLPLDRPDLRSEKITSNETVCVLSNKHPLSRKPTLTPQLLRREPLILLGFGRVSRSQIDAAFAEQGIHPDVRLETHTVSSACALAARGLGIALVNELLARYYLRPGMALCKFEPAIIQEYAFVSSALSKPTRLTMEFIDQTKRHFATLK